MTRRAPALIPCGRTSEHVLTSPVAIVAAILGLVVGASLAVLVSLATHRALSRRIAVQLVPAKSFDPDIEAVVRFAAGLARSRRYGEAGPLARASAPRVRLDTDEAGHLRYTLEFGLQRRCGRSSSGLRLSLRLWLRPTLRPSLRRPIEATASKRRSQHGLRAWWFADISTHSPGRNIKSNRGALVALAISLLAPLALGAFAIASAPAPQRFAGSTAPIALGATAIASALARHRPIASALASQRFGAERSRAWRLA